MTEVNLEWRSDFVLDGTGDLLLVDGDDEVRQRLERRLFTPQQGYVWHPTYGAGLPQRIGRTYTRAQIQAIVSSQVYQEASVAAFPPAQIQTDVSPNEPDNVGIAIKYWDAATGVAVSFTITV